MSSKLLTKQCHGFSSFLLLLLGVLISIQCSCSQVVVPQSQHYFAVKDSEGQPLYPVDVPYHVFTNRAPSLVTTLQRIDCATQCTVQQHCTAFMLCNNMFSSCALFNATKLNYVLTTSGSDCFSYQVIIVF